MAPAGRPGAKKGILERLESGEVVIGDGSDRTPRRSSSTSHGILESRIKCHADFYLFCQ
ncbi:BHMT2 isoform 3 [Pan troglodytes]|uniref:Betaine--homocysteine S-methyltransferase 2 n=2 Tax=Homininae TaxID=207598 RepID=E5RGH5_HUMAN|nr:BHMT2 isoform 3 [Pan troglodytes]